MNKDLGYLVIIAMVMAAIFLVYLQFRWNRSSAKKRSEAIKAVANSLDLSFTEKDEQAAQMVLANFTMANSDKDLNEWSVQALNILRGERAGAQLLLCDLKWTTSHGKSSGRLSTTLAYWQSSALDLPEFSLVSTKWGTHGMQLTPSACKERHIHPRSRQ